MRRASIVVDVVSLVVFVAIGRASHHHAETAAGFLSTLWPFAIGLLVGWRVVGRRRASPRGGLAVAVVTTAVGMVLRVIAGQGTAAAFIVVALVFLSATMGGGRLVLRALPGRRREPAKSAIDPRL